MGNRQGHSGHETNPWLATLTVVLAVAVVGFSGYLITSYPPEATVTASEAARSTSSGTDSESSTSPSPSRSKKPRKTAEPEPEPEPEPEGPQVAVLSDGYTAGSSMGGNDDAAWPEVLSERTGVATTTYAVNGSGYRSGSDGGKSFEDRAGDMLRDWRGGEPGEAGDAIIVFGSRSDAVQDPFEVQAAAERTLGFLASKNPEATVIAVGPVWPTQFPVENGEVATEAVRAAAEAAGVAFVNPQDPPWFSEDNAELIGDNEIQPTDEGHAYLADQMEQILRDQGVITD